MMARANINDIYCLFILLLLTCLLNLISAFPLDLVNDSPSTNNTITQSLSKRGCKLNTSNFQWECDEKIPTMGNLIDQMQKEPGGLATSSRHVVFYTNLNDPSLLPGKDPSASWVVGWLDANGFREKYFWWGRCVNQYWLNAQSKFIRENQQKLESTWGKNALTHFEQCFFQAMSLAAIKEDAYLLTPKDTDWKADSAWATIEFPTLTRNPKVKRIWRVDPRPPKERGLKDDCEPDKPVLIWDRAKDKEVANLPWLCPFR